MSDLTFRDRDGRVYPVRSPDGPLPESVSAWAKAGAAVLNQPRRGTATSPDAARQLAEALLAVVRTLVPDLPDARIAALTLQDILRFGNWWMREWHKAQLIAGATPVRSA
jgi:hypothetical protein